MAPFRPYEPRPRLALGARLLIVGGVIAVLWLGQEVLAPLALALLLTIACLPVAAFLERHGLPRVPAVLLVLLMVLALIGGVAWVVGTQALALAAELPAYEGTLRAKLASIASSSGPIQGVMDLFERLSSGLSPTEAPPAATVAVAAGASSPFAALLAAVHVVLAPLATVLITLLLMGFLLVQREDLRDRVLRLAGTQELHRTTGAMLDATDRVGRFLLTQAMTNAAFGLLMGAGLWALGLPNAPLWGALCFTLRFIPYLGAPLSVVFPMMLAFATTEGWWTVLGIVALFVAVDGIITYVLEPLLFGHTIGVTPIALVLSTAFWAVLWGPLGLILAPALTACIVILGRHVPGFGFLDVLLGDAPPLPLPARFLSRLLAGDGEGAASLLDAEAAASGEREALETLALPAIAQVEADRGQDGFGPAVALRAARTLLRVLEERDEEPAEPSLAVRPVAGALDHAAAAAVALLLAEDGHAPTLEARRAQAVVLVMASAAARPRLERALRAARALAPRVILLAATEEAEAAIAGAHPFLPGMDRLREELAPLRPEEEDQPPARAAE
ncbi:AI-2E family transporter [Roseococcus sp. DSY-14]|uniref:AI-2E family transporter n=1 Tax=Roseococcus sp. DSY-14 TaxID=3369650 RepID=UPI00387B6F46